MHKIYIDYLILINIKLLLNRPNHKHKIFSNKLNLLLYNLLKTIDIQISFWYENKGVSKFVQPT